MTGLNALNVFEEVYYDYIKGNSDTTQQKNAHRPRLLSYFFFLK